MKENESRSMALLVGLIKTHDQEGKTRIIGISVDKEAKHSTPYFHIFNENNQIDTNIGIFDAKYINQESNNNLKLNQSQLKLLNDWFEMPKRNHKNISNWEYGRLVWEKTHHDNYTYLYTDKPDYTQLK